MEDTDRLNREPIARSVARLLNDQIFKDKKSLKHSFMIHIQGAWGDGKSTFLNLLDKHLKGVDDRGNGVKEKDSKWVIVNFNAWRHQHIDPPWWILMDTVYQSIQKSKGRKRGIWWRERWWRLVKLNSMYWVAFLVLLAIFLLLNFSLKFKGLNIVELINNPADGKMLLSVITSYISIIGSAWFLIKAISGSLIPGSSRAANEFKKNVRDPMDMLKRHFEKVINYTNKNVAVFIDDLDRCNAEFTVGLLEGIQTLFSEQPVLYVVAGDRHWISACFENHYDDYKDVAKEPAQRLGYLFLEKAFQLSFRLPKVSGEVKNEILKNYSQDELIIPENMEKIMEDSQLDIEEVTDIVLEVMDSSHEDIHHLLRNHYHLIDANPRSIKRLANQYTVYRNILIAEGREFDRDKLFRWLILQNKYPIYVDWLETNLQDYTRGKDAPEELKELEEDDKWKQLLLDEKNENKGKLLPADISVFTGTGEEIK